MGVEGKVSNTLLDMKDLRALLARLCACAASVAAIATGTPKYCMVETLCMP
jgi:hypothetical protein